MCCDAARCADLPRAAVRCAIYHSAQPYRAPPGAWGSRIVCAHANSPIRGLRPTCAHARPIAPAGVHVDLSTRMPCAGTGGARGSVPRPRRVQSALALRFLWFGYLPAGHHCRSGSADTVRASPVIGRMAPLDTAAPASSTKSPVKSLLLAFLLGCIVTTAVAVVLVVAYRYSGSSSNGVVSACLPVFAGRIAVTRR